MAEDKEKQAPEPRPSRDDYEKSLSGLGDLKPAPTKPDTQESDPSGSEPKTTGSNEN